MLKKDKNKIGENIPHLEITEVVSVHCNNVSNDCQHDSRVLYAFVCYKSFGQILNISPNKNLFLKSFNPEFSYIEVWFTDQNSKLLLR